MYTNLFLLLEKYFCINYSEIRFLVVSGNTAFQYQIGCIYNFFNKPESSMGSVCIKRQCFLGQTLMELFHCVEFAKINH